MFKKKTTKLSTTINGGTDSLDDVISKLMREDLILVPVDATILGVILQVVKREIRNTPPQKDYADIAIDPSRAK